MKKDIYIEILEYAESKTDGFTFFELANDLNLSDERLRALNLERTSGDVFTSAQTSVNRGHGTEDLLFLSFEGKFKLLEHIELQEARKSSKSAMVVAIVAIVISIFVGLYQIFIPQDIILVGDETVQSNENKTETLSQSSSN